MSWKSQEIAALSVKDIDSLCHIDGSGFLFAPGESLDEYKRRILSVIETMEQFNSELEDKKTIDLDGVPPLEKDSRISPEILDEAAEITDSQYHFKVDWVPGFFLAKGVGILWGGCAVSFHESPLTLFVIRANFAKKKRWLLYRRDELLSHELCHIARMPIGDRQFEEFFAYRLSPSAFRRYFGGAFRSEADSIFFILPIFLLLIIQILVTLSLVNLPILPFWLLAVAYPAYLVVRNQKMRNIARQAVKNLSRTGVKEPYSVIFRCNADEIRKIATFRKTDDNNAFQKWISESEKREIRWKIIVKKFMSQKQEK